MGKSAADMDSPERLVIRRKKASLMTYFTLRDEHLELLMEMKLLKKTDTDLIKSEASMYGRVGRLLDLLPAESGGLDGLCACMDGDTEWIADELRAEMAAELGTLEIEDSIYREACVLVHREFGASKRLAEGEKTKLSQLVALRTQFAKEVWRNQLDKASESLSHWRSLNKDKDVQAVRTLETVEKFLETNAARLKKPETNDPRARQARRMKDVDQNEEATVAHPERNSETTTKNGEEKAEEVGVDQETKPVFEKLRTKVKELTKLADECASERELLTLERKRALNVLNVSDTQSAKLEPLLRDTLTKSAKDLKDVREKVKAREDKCRDIEHKLHTCWAESEKAIINKDEIISRLNEQLRVMQERIREQQFTVIKLQQDYRTATSELKQCKERTTFLERNRRLGYLSDNGSPAGGSTKLPSIKDGKRRSHRGETIATSWQTMATE